MPPDGKRPVADVRRCSHDPQMRHQTAFISLSTALMVTGIAVAAAFYALIPGYAALYSITLALAVVVALLAFGRTSDPATRGPAGVLLAACTIYWTLGRVELPDWATRAALLLTPLAVASALVGLRNRSSRQPSSGS